MSYTIKSISSSDTSKNSLSHRNKKTTYMVYGFFAVLFLIILSLFFSFNSGRAYQQFKNNLDSNDFTKAQVLIEPMESILEDKYGKYVTSDKNSILSRKKYLQKFIKALDTLSSNQSVNTVEAVRDLKQFVLHLATVGGSGLSTQGNRYRRQMMEVFPQLLESFKKLRKKQIITPIIERENQDRVYQQSILAQDLATEFGLLMGLAPVTLKGPSDRTQFYSSGILQGLPVLKKLPDDIKDLKNLKRELEIAGGKVSLRGDSKTPEKFMAKLAELREKCSVFAEQIEKLEDTTGDKQEEIDKLETQFKRKLNVFTKLSKLFLVEYLKP